MLLLAPDLFAHLGDHDLGGLLFEDGGGLVVVGLQVLSRGTRERASDY
jgi:hypothetical protein